MQLKSLFIVFVAGLATAGTSSLLAAPVPNKALATKNSESVSRVAPLSRAITPVRLGLATALNAPAARGARATFLDSLALAKKRLFVPMKAPAFDVRLAAFRDAVQIFFSAYEQMRRDPALASERENVDRAIQDALSVLPANDPTRPLLEGLWSIGAFERAADRQESPRSRESAYQAVLQGTVISVVAVVASHYSNGKALSVANLASPLLAKSNPGQPEILAWKSERDASLAKVIENARKPAEAERADARLNSAIATLRALIVDLETSLLRG